MEAETPKEDENPYKCEKCDFCCESVLSLKSHTLEEHGEKDEVQIKCPECDFNAVSQSFLTKHLSAEHSGPIKLPRKTKIGKIKISRNKTKKKEINPKHSEKDGENQISDVEMSIGECNELFTDIEVYDNDLKDDDWGEV